MVLDVGRIKHRADLMHRSVGSNGTATPSNWVLSADGLTNVVWTPRDAPGGGSVSYGSNSNDVSSHSAAGASALVSRVDHVHRGLRSLSHSSNTFFGDVILVPGQNMAITSPTPGTFALSSAGAPGPAGSGGGGAAAAGTLVQSIVWATFASAGTRTFGAAPTNGNTLYAFFVSNTAIIASITQTNVVWTIVGKTRLIGGGNTGVTEIWKGEVSASAGTVVTINLTGGSTQAIIFQEYSGLTAPDTVQSTFYYNGSGSATTENQTLAFSAPGGRAFLLVQNSTGGAIATPAGWTASTGSPFNYGGTGHGALYDKDASSGLYAVHARVVPVAADQHVALLMHALP